MNLGRHAHDPGPLVDFYQGALESLGAVCDRTWFDRLELVAEGSAARLWNNDGSLCQTELQFLPADASGARDASREVFPGCPLTFRLAEALLPSTLTLERAVLAADPGRPPALDVAEKLWRAQWPAERWTLSEGFKLAHHFSVLALIRCELQAIDQHWSLHRIALSLPNGEWDETLATEFDFANLASVVPSDLIWPVLTPAQLAELIRGAVDQAVAPELREIRRRQENYLRRELNRVDDYFTQYVREMSERANRSGSKTKVEDRLAAARTDHARKRADQVQRHEIRLLPRVDALLILAEPAWQAKVTTVRQGETRQQTAHFIPRSRHWVAGEIES